MLILSRKKSEQIMIDDDVIVTIVEIKGGQVKIGIDAPPEVEIHRSEIYQLIQQEKENE